MCRKVVAAHANIHTLKFHLAPEKIGEFRNFSSITSTCDIVMASINVCVCVVVFLRNFSFAFVFALQLPLFHSHTYYPFSPHCSESGDSNWTKT